MDKEFYSNKNLLIFTEEFIDKSLQKILETRKEVEFYDVFTHSEDEYWKVRPRITSFLKENNFKIISWANPPRGVSSRITVLTEGEFKDYYDKKR